MAGDLSSTKTVDHENGMEGIQKGGISAVFDINDSVEDHIRDTIVAGAYLCDEEAVEVVCREGPEQVLELIEMGAAFDRGEDGVLHLGREGGHSHHRIVHAKDMTGREIERALLSAASKHPNIQIFEHHFAIDFLTRMDGDAIKCQGIDAINTSTGAVVRFLSEVTMLAAGGAGHLYPCTTNPKVATGDGLAMAFRAHTVVSNMEFIQFHPTALADAGLPNPPKSRDNAFLITEAVRGAGGILYNQDGERFMLEYDPRKELAPRDVVARSIDDQLKKRNEKYVFLDISHKPREEILSHFPNIAAECLKYGLDITKDPIPVVPAAHYICGGVQTGLHGETSIDGLYACGEVAHTGLHGANRLASNSLLEALVFSQRAILPSIAYMKSASSQGCDVWEVDSEFWPRPMSWKSMKKSANYTAVMKYTETCRRRLQAIMWDYVGIVRSTERLKIARRELARLERSWEDRLAWYIGYQGNVASVEICEMRNLFVGGKLVVESALKRQESRGLHYTLDFLDVVESERHPTVLVPSASRQLFGAAHV
ncbi:hypothetical protein CBR_g41133 [Chara braunii]|uniref:L-aspartate oxidase n=1 Tax=Chara braunii TaxID=69332 RepID=A0A388LV86_CHABU|nr:hypothetical protein CBR_g41133 [Chara braunii]|eukprot:GBG86228.1 hypothetical protein CBR_g41133 [Chara braunii]